MVTGFLFGFRTTTFSNVDLTLFHCNIQWYDLLPPLVRGICQIKTYLCSFFSNEGSFSHLFDSLDSRIETNFIGLCL